MGPQGYSTQRPNSPELPFATAVRTLLPASFLSATCPAHPSKQNMAKIQEIPVPSKSRRKAGASVMWNQRQEVSCPLRRWGSLCCNDRHPVPGDNPESSGRKRPLPLQAASVLSICARAPEISTQGNRHSIWRDEPLRPTMKAQLILHSDVAASNTGLLGDKLKVTGILSAARWLCSCVYVHAHTGWGSNHLGS